MANKWAPRVTKRCVSCGEPFEVRLSQASRYKSCGRPECTSKAYSLATQNRSLLIRQKIGETRKRRFAEGRIRSRIREFRYSGNKLTAAEENIAPYLKDRGFIPHFQINTGLCARYGHSSMFVVDFACPDKKAYIEIDGRPHRTLSILAHDTNRAIQLFLLGWIGLRFSNDDVSNRLSDILHEIDEWLNHM